MSVNCLQIVNLRRILSLNLEIPEYQRPYRWSTESAITLFSDTYNAYQSKVHEYRMGSIVIHDDNGSYKIVDGQQRLTTLSILIYCIFKSDTSLKGKIDAPKLLIAHYNDLSTESIVSNYKVLMRMVKEIDKDKELHKLKGYFEYLLDNCTMVQIVTDSEQEAFQFFDSQNSRGRALVPHDLLKSYHLREMNDEDESEKRHIVDKWESTKQKDLEVLFEDNLYPLVRWYKYQDGLGYSTKKIKTFKGINRSNTSNFAIFNRAAHLYVERFNHENMYELSSGKLINQFQLTQPIIAGKRFFEYSSHYLELKRQIEQIIDFRYKDLIPETGTGDGYIKSLFVNVLVFFVDKFNLEALTDFRLAQLYRWSYSLRLVMKSVYKESVNLYAEGKNTRINYGLNIFAKISEMHDPEELDALMFDDIKREDFDNIHKNNNKYSPIYEHIWE